MPTSIHLPSFFSVRPLLLAVCASTAVLVIGCQHPTINGGVDGAGGSGGSGGSGNKGGTGNSGPGGAAAMGGHSGGGGTMSTVKV